MDKKELKTLINASEGRDICDLAIVNARVIDVFNVRVILTDVYIKDGYIVGLGNKREAKKTIDAHSRFLIPGFIDAHCHIESSHLSPSEFSSAVIPEGTTTVIADPHEICNVRGLDAMSYMLDSAKDAALSIFFMFPSCVPATPFEHSGAILNAEEIATMIDNDKILGLGEMMNYPGVISADDMVFDKIQLAKDRKKIIDGHVPSIRGKDLEAYIASGISTDHETETSDELVEKIEKGMYVLLRQGTVCKDVLNLVKGVNQYNYRRCLFCTDDRQPKSIKREGHVNYGVNLAIGAGLNPLLAISMASLNASECYNLKDRGAIAPGRRADFFLSDSIENIRADEVFIKGELVAKGGKAIKLSPKVDGSKVKNTINIKNLSLSSFFLPLKSDTARTILVLPGGVVTGEGEAKVKRDSNNEWVYNKEQDVLKLTVIERHHALGTSFSALIEGFGLKKGAIASTIGHDSHNLIAVGTNDSDMLLAAKELERVGGGIALALDGKILKTHVLELGGLMTDKNVDEVAKELEDLDTIVKEKMGGVSEGIDPFMTLCFMALPVIPALKLTDTGLFDVRTFSFVEVSK